MSTKTKSEVAYVAKAVGAQEMMQSIRAGIPIFVKTGKYDQADFKKNQAAEAEKAQLLNEKEERRAARKAQKEEERQNVANAAAMDLAASLDERWEAEEDRVAEIADAGTLCALQNVSSTVKERDVVAMLEKYGAVQHINMIRSSLNPHMCNVNVMFKTDAGARKAVHAMKPWLRLAHEKPDVDDGQVGSGLGGGRRRRANTSPIKGKNALEDSPYHVKKDRSVELAAMVPPRTPALDHGRLVTMSETAMGPTDPKRHGLNWKSWTSGRIHHHSSAAADSEAPPLRAFEARRQLLARSKSVGSMRAEGGVTDTNIPGNEKTTHLRELWGKVDVDGSGYLDKNELQQMLAMLGQLYKGAALTRKMLEIDDDDSGFVSYVEFEAWWRASKGGTVAVELEEDDEGDLRPTTAAPTKQANQAKAHDMRLKPRHEISFESVASAANPNGLPQIDHHGNSRHHVFDDTRGWRTKTHAVRRSRPPKKKAGDYIRALPKELLTPSPTAQLLASFRPPNEGGRRWHTAVSERENDLNHSAVALVELNLFDQGLSTFQRRAPAARQMPLQAGSSLADLGASKVSPPPVGRSVSFHG
jgi:hypothetical protein